MRPLWAEKKSGPIHSRISIPSSAWHKTSPGEHGIYLGIVPREDIGQKSFSIVDPWFQNLSEEEGMAIQRMPDKMVKMVR